MNFVKILIFSIFWSQIAAITPHDRAVLEALHSSANGANWRRSWNFSMDLCDEDGVYCTVDGSVYSLYLSRNKLSGSIPSEIGSLSSLQLLWLDDNQLSGSIPPEIGSLSSLRELNLNSNPFSGSIPSEIGSLSSLQLLWLIDNQLSGSIPPEIGSLSSLRRLRLCSNTLSGSIPSEIGSMSSLNDLDLSNNKLSGSIPSEICSLSSIIFVLLQSNILSGSIPSEIGSLSYLAELWLYSNQLSGSIPPEIGSISSLIGLLLYSNQLSGSIPPEIGSLSPLSALMLHNNTLSGSIPPEIGGLRYLNTLLLANNLFSCPYYDYSTLTEYDYFDPLRSVDNDYDELAAQPCVECDPSTVCCTALGNYAVTECGDAGTDCHAQNTCDGSGTCLDNNYQTGIVCGASVSSCTFCSTGECVFDANSCEGCTDCDNHGHWEDTDGMTCLDYESSPSRCSIAESKAEDATAEHAGDRCCVCGGGGVDYAYQNAGQLQALQAAVTTLTDMLSECSAREYFCNLAITSTDPQINTIPLDPRGTFIWQYGMSKNSHPVYKNHAEGYVLFFAHSQKEGVNGWVLDKKMDDSFPYFWGYLYPSDAKTNGEDTSGMWSFQNDLDGVQEVINLVCRM